MSSYLLAVFDGGRRLLKPLVPDFPASHEDVLLRLGPDAERSTPSMSGFVKILAREYAALRGSWGEPLMS